MSRHDPRGRDVARPVHGYKSTPGTGPDAKLSARSDSVTQPKQDIATSGWSLSTSRGQVSKLFRSNNYET